MGFSCLRLVGSERAIDRSIDPLFKRPVGRSVGQFGLLGESQVVARRVRSIVRRRRRAPKVYEQSILRDDERRYLHAIVEAEWRRLDLFGCREQAREQKHAGAD